MSWVYLFTAGLFEDGFTTFLKLSENFSKLWPTIGFLVFSIGSFLFLSKAMHMIPLGTAYALLTGIGAFGTVVVGICFFSDPMSLLRVIFSGSTVCVGGWAETCLSMRRECLCSLNHC